MLLDIVTHGLAGAVGTLVGVCVVRARMKNRVAYAEKRMRAWQELARALAGARKVS